VKRSGTLLVIAVSVALSGCTALNPAPAPTPTVTVAPSGDGVLRIGTLFDLSGPLRAQSPAQVAGVEIAVRDINRAGGFGGVPVELFHRDGSDSATASASFEDLVEKGVDVVIGPSSTAVADTLSPIAAEAGVALISPTAAFSDPGALDFSTAQSPAALAAGVVVARPDTVAALVTFEGSAVDLGGELDAAGLTPALTATFAPDQTDFTRLIAEISTAEATSIIITAPAEAEAETTALLTALLAAGHEGSSLVLLDAALRTWGSSLPDGSLEGAAGVVAGAAAVPAFVGQLRQSDPGLTSSRFGAEAYDAVVLAAIAATLALDDGGPSIAHHLRAASSGGIPCASFAECLDVLSTVSASTEHDIDYVGRSGRADLDSSGNRADLTFTTYTFDAANKRELVVER
jgi:branched-chain amino acid transport system substrate-binding protein